MSKLIPRKSKIFYLLAILLVVILGAFTFYMLKSGRWQSSASTLNGGTIFLSTNRDDALGSVSGLPVIATRTVNGKAVETLNTDINNDGYAKFLNATPGNWIVRYADPPCAIKSLTTQVTSGRTSQLTTTHCTKPAATGTFTLTGNIINATGFQAPISNAIISIGDAQAITNNGKFTMIGIKANGTPSSGYRVNIFGKPGFINISTTLDKLGIAGTPVAGKTYSVSTPIQMTYSTTPPPPPGLKFETYFSVKTNCTASACKRDNRNRINNIPVSVAATSYNPAVPQSLTSNTTAIIANSDINGKIGNVPMGLQTFIVNSPSSPNYNPVYQTLQTTRMVTSSMLALDGKWFYYTEFLLKKK